MKKAAAQVSGGLWGWGELEDELGFQLGVAVA